MEIEEWKWLRRETNRKAIWWPDLNWSINIIDFFRIVLNEANLALEVLEYVAVPMSEILNNM